MNISFSGEINPIATYAAILSTLIAVWELFKWKNRNSVKLICTPNMLIIPDPNDAKYIVAKLTNKGNFPTTVTHFLGYCWPNVIDKILKRNQKAFLVNCDNVPSIINPGEEWIGKLTQDESIEKMARFGVLYVGIVHSMGHGEILRRIKIDK